MDIRIQHTSRSVLGEITLEGSKSISNRLLIIRALSSEKFRIDRISKAEDTLLLEKLLSQKSTLYDCGTAGTTFRFLTAYFAIQKGEQVLTGSERMKQRPIGELVKCLRQIGANIEYLENEGFPPLLVKEPNFEIAERFIEIDASISSQFISALLLIAPVLPHGLTIKLNSSVASRPYIQMTLSLLSYFGIEYGFENDLINIAKQNYKGKDIIVEADWSAASYYYVLAAFSDNTELQLNGLFIDSMQGDSIIQKIGDTFGVQTLFNSNGIKLVKKENKVVPFFEFDFQNYPDLAQSIAVLVAGKGIVGLFSGIESLKIKETDRIQALKSELEKIGFSMIALPGRFSKDSSKKFYQLEGSINSEIKVSTYGDHRMALSFFPLGILNPVTIYAAEVVNKSYPNVWKDLKEIGYKIDLIK
ncbi:MAG: 3-phosphoshikimate 1-carboxyvinyltransferase [Saprospiraceae bacterium]